MGVDEVTHLSARCPRCGRALAPDAPEELCAACLLTVGAETLTGEMDDGATAWSRSASGGGDDQRLFSGQSWGPYRIGRLLGRGGMGEVYEAEHAESGRRIALKVLRSRLEDADDRARFLREGQLAASVSHPHAVYIFGSEEIAGMPVIAMELLPGGTLKDRVAAHGPMKPTEAVSAVLDIVGGLDAAQAAGILHRDIKPSNCFIDSDGSVKVGDFGLSISTLARDVYQELPSGGFQGTPQFAPPEQLRGEPLDVRADIYAVGATLYFLLTGHPPFDARDLRELVARVTSEPPGSPRLTRPEIPPGLAAIVLQCLAKTPAERPASYAALADALRPFSVFQDTTAGLGSRGLAGLADSLVLSVPVGVWSAWASDPFARSADTTTTLVAWTWVVQFVYYACLEGTWGASLGKRLFGLKVTAIGGRPASWSRILLRTAIFCLPNLLLALATLVVSTQVMNALSSNPVLAAARAMVTLALLAALFLTARRRNGWAAVHDLVSGTRVVARSVTRAKHVGFPADAGSERPAASHPPGLRYGPFTVNGDASATDGGRLFVGFDPVLRRQVWIHDVARDAPPLSSARRDVSRVGRLHWLTGRRSDREHWDAFEAPAGEPFLGRNRAPAAWPALKSWLLDLTNELTMSTSDGTVPRLGLDRLWVRRDGRIVLLDFPPPDAQSDSGSDAPIAAARSGSEDRDLTPVALLSAVVAHARSATASSSAPDLMPLSARRLLDTLAGSTPPTLDQMRAGLARVAAVPDHVQWWRRALPIALAAAPVVLLVAGALLILPGFSRMVQGEQMQMMGWLDMLHRPDPPAGSRMSDPAFRDAVETYVAARYASSLTSERIWSTAVMRQGRLAELRQVAADIAKRRPAVPDDEMKRVAAVLAPEIQRLERHYASQASSIAGAAGVIVSTLSAVSLLFVLGCGVISSLAVPGGIVTRLLGLAAVTRNGMEIGRGRSMLRVMVIWSPAIAWLAYLAASPKLQGWVPAPPSPLLGTAATLCALAIGAAWTLSRMRGPHDLLVGTWVVPR